MSGFPGDLTVAGIKDGGEDHEGDPAERHRNRSQAQAEQLRARGGVLVRLGRSRGFSSDRLANLLALLVVCGLAGARTFFVAEHWADYRADPASALRIWEGGLMFYGSIVFGAAALVAHCRLARTPVLPLLDLFAVAVPVGQAFGRVGCLLNGCCYGRPSDSCLAVTYPRWSIPCIEQIRSGLLPEDAARSLPVLPSQLFEAAGCVLLFLAGLVCEMISRNSADRNKYNIKDTIG